MAILKECPSCGGKVVRIETLKKGSAYECLECDDQYICLHGEQPELYSPHDLKELEF